jgi:hypothetical protein
MPPSKAIDAAICGFIRRAYTQKINVYAFAYGSSSSLQHEEMTEFRKPHPSPSVESGAIWGQT